MEDTSNWDDNALKIPVLKWTDRESPELGLELTSTFGKVAEANGLSYVGIQFRKGHPKEGIFDIDSVNCSKKELKELFEEIANVIKESK